MESTEFRLVLQFLDHSACEEDANDSGVEMASNRLPICNGHSAIHHNELFGYYITASTVDVIHCDSANTSDRLSVPANPFLNQILEAVEISAEKKPSTRIRRLYLGPFLLTMCVSQDSFLLPLCGHDGQKVWF